MNNRIQILLTLLMLTGCSLKSNVTYDPKFSSFVGRDITLKKQVLLCEDKPLKTEDGHPISLKLVYNIHENINCFFGKTIGLLPAGTKIRIEKVEKHKILGIKTATLIYFIGNSYIRNGKQFDFYYVYGHEGFYDSQPW